MKHRKNALYIALTLALAGTMPLTAHAINLPATGYGHFYKLRLIADAS
jgi:hypothetical protein